MTTTELIELLKKNERGGATGRPREVMFEVDDRIIDTDGIEVTGSGDGLISELYLSLPSAQRWIPCSERLPEDGTDIFVTYVDEEETRIIPVNYGRGTWFDCIFDRALDSLKVTAWMPLPEPWKGEDDERID